MIIRVNLIGCKCGCGSTNTGFRGWAPYHWMRDRRQWNKGLTKEMDARVKGPCKGTKPWCTGLSKKTDIRLLKLANSVRLGHHDCSGSNNSMYGRTGLLAPNWDPDREAVKMRARLRGMAKSLLHRALPISCHGKIDHTEKMLGYTRQQLKEHLEKKFIDGMSWENYGDGIGRWHIDHVRPIASFPLGSLPNEVSALSNLQPLWSNENHMKWKKWDG
jgi:hypothetical protein